MHPEKTIAAVTTPPGTAGIGIVRLSGPLAKPILQKIFRPADKKAEPPPRLMRLGWIVADDDRRVDQVLAVFMPGPASYTKEDVVELHCHGGQLVLAAVLELVLANGAEPAGPGEFTRRAFTGGRIDLAQAEAVIDLINAGSRAGLALCEDALAGGLSRRIATLQDLVGEVTALVEAHIDFPEDELGSFPVDEALTKLTEARQGASELAATYDEGRLLWQGVRTVLAGRPNVGKSSWLNRLLGRERAIVTEHPGTTRDVLEEFIQIEGVPFRLADVAGLRETIDPIEAEGLRLAKDKIGRADLTLLISDASRPPDQTDRELLTQLTADLNGGAKLLFLLNKIDLATQDNKTAWQEFFQDQGHSPLAVSARTGQGQGELTTAMRKIALSGELPAAGEVIVTRARHRRALLDAAQALSQAMESLQTRTLDLAAVDLREALYQLGLIVGQTTTEDLLDKIFSEMCIGK